MAYKNTSSEPPLHNASIFVPSQQLANLLTILSDNNIRIAGNSPEAIDPSLPSDYLGMRSIKQLKELIEAKKLQIEISVIETARINLSECVKNNNIDAIRVLKQHISDIENNISDIAALTHECDFAYDEDLDFVVTQAKLLYAQELSVYIECGHQVSNCNSPLPSLSPPPSPLLEPPILDQVKKKLPIVITKK